jgi:2-polyprenyl-6-methoxyphenol hydroxylase-like FAD-dependent oxidoreductase
VTPASGDRLDVLVVGAGPTGVTLAAQLQACGATVRIVDRQLDRVHESRALAVQPRTLEVLRGLGVTQQLLARGNDAVWVQLHAGGRAVRVRLFGLGLADTAYPFLLFVSQTETEAILNEHLAAGGVQVERGVELGSFHADPDGVTCTLRHRGGRTEQVHSRYLVGCDGAHSAVRRQAGIPFSGGAYPQTFALADLEVDGGLVGDTATPSSARWAWCSSSRWAGLPAGGCWACTRPSRDGGTRSGPRWRSCRRWQMPSPVAGCGYATRSGGPTSGSSTATPPATRPGGCLWPVMPPTCTARLAPRA